MAGALPMANSPGPWVPNVPPHRHSFVNVNVDIIFRLDAGKIFCMPGPLTQLVAAEGPRPMPLPGPLASSYTSCLLVVVPLWWSVASPDLYGTLFFHLHVWQFFFTSCSRTLELTGSITIFSSTCWVTPPHACHIIVNACLPNGRLHASPPPVQCRACSLWCHSLWSSSSSSLSLSLTSSIPCSCGAQYLSLYTWTFLHLLKSFPFRQSRHLKYVILCVPLWVHAIIIFMFLYPLPYCWPRSLDVQNISSVRPSAGLILALLVLFLLS